jgi:hypothetical protein
MKWCWIFSKAFFFFCIYWKDQVCLFLLLLMCSITLVICICWTILHHWDEVNLVMVHDLLYMLLDSVCHYFVEGFCINAH